MASSLSQKLQIKPGVEIDIIHTPDELKDSLRRELSQNPLEFDPSEAVCAVLIFLKNLAEVEAVALPTLGNLDGTFPVWLLYPKGTSGVSTDINRDILWKTLEPLGWRPARMIALDEIWSFMRFTRKSNRQIFR